ncbi:vitelline membrane outer layer protein 1 homolog [Carettochelys insculpta]|uniref:vitelline membrane outer layer protein 1 homolog n=1 Tax=Carettochelys insculpta TaxID=44489 RepID=UPI003EBC25AA
MDTSWHARLAFVLCCCLWGAWAQTKITVSNGGHWGEWGKEESCPPGTYANGFALKVEFAQLAGDDTALNGIRLICSNGSTIQSTVGPWGHWGLVKKCPCNHRLMRFRLRTQQCQGLKDDSGATNIEFECTDGTELRGQGCCWGTWGPQSNPCGQEGICTIATKVEPPKGKGDDTALNDVYFRCCNQPQPQPGP